MLPIPGHIFRAYDIRGMALTELTLELSEAIGRAFGSELKERYGLASPRVAVGRDARTHSAAIERALVVGLRSTGCCVQLIGQTPSPVNYFTICDRKLDGGIQVTGSHNGPADNGMKLQIRNAEPFSGEEILGLLRRIERGDFATGKGAAEEIDACTPYLSTLSSLLPPPQADPAIRVVVDSGNGVAGPLYCEALRRFGCEVLELYTEPDGTFPHHPADPSKWETLRDLQTAVKSDKADLGLAFDGDGDRLGVVDERGQIVSPDHLLLLLAQDHLQRHPGATVVFTVSNSSILETEISTWRGKPLMCPVGHTAVEHTMHEHGALLGGEQSGHFFCGEDYFCFDDALVAALREVSILATRREKEPALTFSRLLEAFPTIYQMPEWRPHCPDDCKADIIRRVTAHFSARYPCITIDGVRIDFGDGAWAGIRQSNTSPRISVCCEARSPEKLKEIEGIVKTHLKQYREIGE